MVLNENQDLPQRMRDALARYLHQARNGTRLLDLAVQNNRYEDLQFLGLAAREQLGILDEHRFCISALPERDVHFFDVAYENLASAISRFRQYIGRN